VLCIYSKEGTGALFSSFQSSLCFQNHVDNERRLHSLTLGLSHDIGKKEAKAEERIYFCTLEVKWQSHKLQLTFQKYILDASKQV